jgi:hypothetical protein
MCQDTMAEISEFCTRIRALRLDYLHGNAEGVGRILQCGAAGISVY